MTKPAPPSDRRMRRGSQWAFTVLGVFLLALVTAACGGDEAETAGTDSADAEADEAFPEDNIRDVIPVDVGGGLDTASRAYQRFWEERLGVQINVENVPGASHAIGLQSVADTGQDCNTVVTTAIPHLLYSYLTQDVDFDYENSFYPVGAVQTQPAAI
ncbi:MAG: hypothetical protein GEU81_06620, partial [Nitriliruptorales bacterium]|nr:hypothetical protein [Nitriliruptorales bacterium]